MISYKVVHHRWVDTKAGMLYLWPNETASAGPPSTLGAGVLETVVCINGTFCHYHIITLSHITA